MKHTLSIILQNKPGALSRVTGPASTLQAAIDILRPIGIKESFRTGTISISRAAKNR